jgi:hypothetical protein
MVLPPSDHGELDLEDGVRGGFDFLLVAAKDRAGVHYGADDSGVGCAAADVSGEGGFDLILGGIGVFVEESFGGYDPSGGAEAAVGGYADVSYALQWVEIGSGTYAFDGLNVFSGGFGGESMAGVDRRAVN